MNHIKPEHGPEVDRLIAGLWDGEINQADFAQLALKAGMSVKQINAVLDEIHDEDGT
jgi:hypothetical protein